MTARRPSSGQGGQAVLEVALALPVVVLLLLAAVQVALVGRAQVGVEHAAREAVRAVAVAVGPQGGGDAVGEARAAAASATSLRPLVVSVRRDGGLVAATVRHHVLTDVPLAGALVGDVVVTATATMRAEP